MENKNNDFTVRYPVEYFSEMIKEDGLKDGAILENQQVVLDTVTMNTEHVVIEGHLVKRIDA